MATKKCPYCGEEIQEEAKKCRFCGEWLVEKEAPIPTASEPEPEEEELDDDIILKSHIPFSDLLIKILFWVAIFGLIISSIHDAVPEGQTLSTSIGSGRTRLYNAFLNLCLAIPEWVGLILEGGAFALLLYSLMTGMKHLKESLNGLFSWYLTLFLAGQVFFILSSFMEDEGVVSVLGVLVGLAQIVIQFVIGLKLNKLYQGEIKKLGVTFITCSSLLVVMYIAAMIIPVAFYLGDFEETYLFIVVFLGLIIEWIAYSAVKNVQLYEADDD